MKTRVLVPVLLLSAVLVSPASANWFSNPGWSIKLNLGSAPNPTPEDIRANRQPVLVTDGDGNVVAMIDRVTGKVLATAEPQAAPKPNSGGTRATPSSARAR